MYGSYLPAAGTMCLRSCQRLPNNLFLYEVFVCNTWFTDVPGEKTSKHAMASETAWVWTNTSIMIVRSSKSRSEAVSLPTVDTVTCHGFGHEDHQVEDFDVQGSGNEPHRAVSALHLGEGVMKSSAGRSHGEKRNIVLPLSARRKTRLCVENQTRSYKMGCNIRRLAKMA